MKHTPWFCIKTTRPGKDGVYELLHVTAAKRFSRYMDGKWRLVCANPRGASFMTFTSAFVMASQAGQDGFFTHWRGLTTKDGK